MCGAGQQDESWAGSLFEMGSDDLYLRAPCEGRTQAQNDVTNTVFGGAKSGKLCCGPSPLTFLAFISSILIIHFPFDIGLRLTAQYHISSLVLSTRFVIPCLTQTRSEKKKKMSVSLSPPPRKQYASPNTTARLPKLTVPSEDQGQEQEQDLDHALAQLLSQKAQISHTRRHLPECKHHPSSQEPFDANTATLGSELLALRTGRRPSQSLFPLEGEQVYTRNTTKADDREAWYENRTSPALSSCSYCDNKQGGPLDDIHRMKADALLCQQRMSNLRAMVPQLVRRRLNYHLDECWFVHFSPSGEFLASIGLDQTIALWHDMMVSAQVVWFCLCNWSMGKNTASHL